MNPATPELLFTAAEVATAAGVPEHALRDLHPSDFGVPGHWRLTRQGGVVYTAKAVAVLAEVLKCQGKDVGAHSLCVLLQQGQETPSRALIPAGSKSATGEPWFRQGQFE